MSRGKSGEIRRNDGFRIADARQVRIEALEKMVQKLRGDCDLARRQRESMRKIADTLMADVEAAKRAKDREFERAERFRAQTIDLQELLLKEREAASAERVTWWNRLFGRAT
jgi:hypothetical protein